MRENIKNDPKINNKNLPKNEIIIMKYLLCATKQENLYI